MKQHTPAPTKMITKTIESEDDAIRDLLHPNHKTLTVYKSRDGQHRISAMRRSNKTWLMVDGKVVRTTQMKILVRALARI